VCFGRVTCPNQAGHAFLAVFLTRFHGTLGPHFLLGKKKGQIGKGGGGAPGGPWKWRARDGAPARQQTLGWPGAKARDGFCPGKNFRRPRGGRSARKPERPRLALGPGAFNREGCGIKPAPGLRGLGKDPLGPSGRHRGAHIRPGGGTSGAPGNCYQSLVPRVLAGSGSFRSCCSRPGLKNTAWPEGGNRQGGKAESECSKLEGRRIPQVDCGAVYSARAIEAPKRASGVPWAGGTIKPGGPGGASYPHGVMGGDFRGIIDFEGEASPPTLSKRAVRPRSAWRFARGGGGRRQRDDWRPRFLFTPRAPGRMEIREFRLCQERPRGTSPLKHTWGGHGRFMGWDFFV